MDFFHFSKWGHLKVPILHHADHREFHGKGLLWGPFCTILTPQKAVGKSKLGNSPRPLITHKTAHGDFSLAPLDAMPTVPACPKGSKASLWLKPPQRCAWHHLSLSMPKSPLLTNGPLLATKDLGCSRQRRPHASVCAAVGGLFTGCWVDGAAAEQARPI